MPRHHERHPRPRATTPVRPVPAAVVVPCSNCALLRRAGVAPLPAVPYGGPVRPDDPRRRWDHDYLVIDPATGRAVGGFADPLSATRWAVDTYPGRVICLHTQHPARCGCPEAPPPGPLPAVGA